MELTLSVFLSQAGNHPILLGILALAMALGASVAPEMMVTPMTSARMPSRIG